MGQINDSLDSPTVEDGQQVHTRQDLPPLADVDTALLDITLTLQAHYPTAPRYAIVRRIASRAMHAERRWREQYEQIIDLTISSGAAYDAR